MKLMFGCLTLGEDEYLGALLGVIPKNLRATLIGYKLMRQKESDIDLEVRKMINYSSDFKSYFAKKTDDPNDKLLGKLWFLTDEQIKILDDWEFEGKWFFKEEIEVTSENGEKYTCFFYNAPSSVGEEVGEISIWPRNKKEFLKHARENNLRMR